MSSLYILDINPFLDISFANILSHSVGGPFRFVSFLHCAKAFLFAVVPFVDFCLCFHCLRRHIQKILLRLMSKSILPMFSSRSFVVLGVTFNPF